MKSRILIIENSTAVTGALKSIIRSSQGLQSEFDFIFLLPVQSSAVKFVEESGFEVHQLAMKELRKNIGSFLIYFPILIYNAYVLANLLKKKKIDMMNVNDFYNLLPACYKFFGGKIPYVCYVRFLPSKFPDPLVAFWCQLHARFASYVIAVSNAVLQELPIRNNVVVIGNELPAEDVPFMPPLSTVLLYPANYIQGKGQEFALESFALIQKKHSQWKLKFVGGDMGLQKNKDFKAGLINRSKILHLSGSVEWHDFAHNVSDEYLGSSIVLNFSESESFSMTCLEGMFYGRPVIATRSGGPAEIIDQNQSGILVELGDVTGMANAIDYLISHPEKRNNMAQRAYKSVRDKFSFDNTIGKLRKIYQKTLKYPLL
jgi:glycosyltransferase involved in cell wall biosynthesis